jgi:PIN domain nuclease of toxin-antitoxin system
VKLLLDTHAFLWFALDDSRLSATGRREMIVPENNLLLSAASAWEIAIKISIGKYQISGDFEPFILEQLTKNSIDYLPIQLAELQHVATLPFHHRDPFDRLLIAQSIAHGLPIISSDELFDAYPIQRVW